MGSGQARVQGLRIIVRIVLTASVNFAFTMCQALFFVLIFVLFNIIFIPSFINIFGASQVAQW